MKIRGVETTAGKHSMAEATTRRPDDANIQAVVARLSVPLLECSPKLLDGFLQLEPMRPITLQNALDVHAVTLSFLRRAD
jgi:hypothetical protein